MFRLSSAANRAGSPLNFSTFRCHLNRNNRKNQGEQVPIYTLAPASATTVSVVFFRFLFVQGKIDCWPGVLSAVPALTLSLSRQLFYPRKGRVNISHLPPNSAVVLSQSFLSAFNWIIRANNCLYVWLCWHPPSRYLVFPCSNTFRLLLFVCLLYCPLQNEEVASSPDCWKCPLRQWNYCRGGRQFLRFGGKCSGKTQPV